MALKTKGYLCGFFASITWGTVFVVGRFIMGNRDINPFIIAFWRCFFAVIFLAIMLRRYYKSIFSINKNDYPAIFLLGFTGIFLFNTLVFYSLKYTTATSSSILMNANPLFILLFATIFLRERMTLGKVFSVITGFAGCVMVIKGTGGISTTDGVLIPLKGNIFALCSAICWALYTVFGGAPSKRYGAILTTFLTISTGAFLFLLVMLVIRINFWNAGWPVILSGAYLGIIPTEIGFTLWYQALKYIPAGELGIFQYLAFVVTAVLSVSFLHEKLNILIITGILFIFLSFYILKVLDGYSARI